MLGSSVYETKLLGKIDLVHWYHPFWLYSITGKWEKQYVILYKLHNVLLGKIQKFLCGGHNCFDKANFA